jgi:hypothetical protein
MARTLKDDVMLATIRECATITGHTNEEVLGWTVKEFRQKMKEAQGDAGPYWQIFLKTLRKNIEDAWREVFTRQGFSISEVVVMEWPRALAEPTSSAADIELDDAADQIRVATR